MENILEKLIDSVTSGATAAAAADREQLMRAQARNVFLVGLNEPLNILVKSQKPVTFENAVEIAVAEERELQSKREVEKFSFNKTSEICQLCGKANHIAKNCFKLKNKKDILTIQTSSKFCKFCKKNGHITEDCWHLNKDTKPNFSNNKPRNNSQPKNLNWKKPSGGGNRKEIQNLKADN